jgi:hypothetical protein
MFVFPDVEVAKKKKKIQKFVLPPPPGLTPHICPPPPPPSTPMYVFEKLCAGGTLAPHVPPGEF